jgi:hypothetical protein
VGLVQYELKLPTELIELHVFISSLIWLAACWGTASAGRLAPKREGATAPLPSAS